MFEEFKDLLDKNKLKEAVDKFKDFNEETQHRLLLKMRDSINEKAPHPHLATPDKIVVLRRYLKNGKSYEDFKQAWIPPIDHQKDDNGNIHADYYHVPVRVINATAADDPNELLSIAFLWTDDETLNKEIERTKPIETQRSEQVAAVTEAGGDVTLYDVRDDNDLGI